MSRKSRCRARVAATRESLPRGSHWSRRLTRPADAAGRHRRASDADRRAVCGPGYASGVNRLLLPTAVLSSLLLAGCGAGDAVYDYGQVAQGVKGKTIAVEIGKGQRFPRA